MIRFCRLRAHSEACSIRTRVRRFALPIVLGLALAVVSVTPSAGDARFDLAGPRIEVHVTRAGVTLPIASVPNLQPGDRLWLHPDLPGTQSVHYLMVLAFLRGTTNPPPDNWFIRIETWNKKVRAEGVEVTVPDEAQQAVLFLAPVTGGDFTTLRSAVQGRPGVFVRASQDLAAAGFEQARIEKYIDSMRRLSPTQEDDPKQLQEHSNLIAATLALQPNANCVKLPPDQQYTCLTQTGTQSLLDDGHGQSIVDALTGGEGAGLIGTASATQLAGSGIYSAYVGTIVDFVHIMGSMHTAQYQYIPAIAFPQQQSLNLRLNTPPSFHNPKSVIVIGLPSVQKTIPPPLRASEPNAVSCLEKPDVVLPVEGAPLVYSTGFAHDLVLHLNYPVGTKLDLARAQDIPLTPDAFRGGLVLAPAQERRELPLDKVSLPTSPAIANDPAPKTSSPSPDVAASEVLRSAELTGTVKGFWGFDPFTGPTLPLQETPGKDWKLTAANVPNGWLIAGEDRHVLLSSTGTACIQSIALEPSTGKPDKENWKPSDKPNTVDVALDLAAHDIGALHLDISQFGDPKPASVSLVSYNVPAKLDALHFHAGDNSAVLVGNGLNQVREVEMGGLTMKPAPNNGGPEPPPPTGERELRLSLAPDSKAPTLPVGDNLVAQIALKDGRTLALPVTVAPARPSVSLIGHADILPQTLPKSEFHIKLSNDNDLPVGDALIFSMRSAQPFPRTGGIEIASPDNSLNTRLSLSDSAPGADAKASLILESPETLLATLQPLKAFGPSAFGPIRLRAVAPDGSAGDWLPLVTLVRLPELVSLSCPVAQPAPVPPAKPAADIPRAALPDSTSAAAATPAANPTTPACTLAGTGLYFIDAIATDADFTNAVHVPQGFVGTSIAVPPPTGAVYYLRLRDDPTSVATAALPAGPL